MYKRHHPKSQYLPKSTLNVKKKIVFNVYMATDMYFSSLFSLKFSYICHSHLSLMYNGFFVILIVILYDFRRDLLSY